MSYIEQIPNEQATGLLRELYDKDLGEDGYVANSTSAFSHRPDVLAAFRETVRLLRTHMRLRRYELVSTVAAAAIGCQYCMLAHGALLRRNGFSVDQVKAILVDFHDAGLPPDEVHMLELVRKFSLDSNAVTPADIQTLLADGFTNDEIADIALAAGVRNFYARFFASLGVLPDEAYKESEPELWAFVMHAGQTPGH